MLSRRQPSRLLRDLTFRPVALLRRPPLDLLRLQLAHAVPGIKPGDFIGFGERGVIERVLDEILDRVRDSAEMA